MDGETRLDIDEAVGKANAYLMIQSAVISMLILKGVFSEGDAATIAGVASQQLSAMEGLSEQARTLAQDALRGYAKSWTATLTRN